MWLVTIVLIVLYVVLVVCSVVLSELGDTVALGLM